MPSTINASTTSTSGLVQTADASGILQLQSDGITGLSIQSGGKIVLPSTALSTASAGTLEYNGSVPLFTPLGTQRGIVPGMQYYRLNSGLVGADSASAQSIYGVGVTLSAGTIYQFESLYALSKTAGTTSHTFQYAFGGTATINNIGYLVLQYQNNTSFTAATLTYSQQYIQTATATSDTIGTRTNANQYNIYRVSGTVSVNAGGTFIPQYQLTSAPGGAYTTAAGSYFLIYPIGAAGSNISVGTWA